MTANTLLTPSQITREALRVLHQKLTFISNINRGYDKEFAVTGAKIGDTLRIRLPNVYVIRKGSTYVGQATTERYVSLQVANVYGVDLDFTSIDLTLSLDDFSKRIIEPACAVIAANIESDCLNSLIKDVWQQIDNQGAAATFRVLLLGRKKLQDALAPADGRTMLLSTTDNVDLVDALKGLFNDQKSLALQYTEGMMGYTAGMNFGETTHLTQQLRGSGANYVVDGANQTGNGILVKTGTGAIKKGEIVKFAGVYRVHPETKLATPDLHQFVVTADYTGGPGTIAISPSLNSAATATQNVSASPADGAAMTIAGTPNTAYGLSLAYHKEAFAFATADLIIDDSMTWAAREVYDGVSMRIAKFYDGVNDVVKTRLDVLCGWVTTRGQLATRIANN